MRLEYHLTLPDNQKLVITRDIAEIPCGAGLGLVESFAICPSRVWAADVEIERPLSVQPAKGGAEGQVTWPLKNGWARECAMAGAKLEAEYRLGNPLSGPETPHLALPMVHAHLGQLDVAIMTDVTFSALFELHDNQGELRGRVRYRYAGSRVPIQRTEGRSMGIFLQPNQPSSSGFDASLDAFFTLMLHDVPAGPAWLHEIAMIDYDFLSDNGQGWERDVQLLAEWLKPEQRKRSCPLSARLVRRVGRVLF